MWPGGAFGPERADWAPIVAFEGSVGLSLTIVPQDASTEQIPEQISRIWPRGSFFHILYQKEVGARPIYFCA